MNSQDADRERLLTVMSNHHDQLVAFARSSYEADGRGVIFVEFPKPPQAGGLVVAAADMTYHTIEGVRALTADMIDTNEDARVLIRMVETYDPARQCVVTASFKGQNPVTVKMRLERTLVSDEPEGVQ
jgi:hypothetical protein